MSRNLVGGCLVVLASLAVTPVARALDPNRLVTQYGLRHFDSADGLPQNSGDIIAQDHDGVPLRHSTFFRAERATPRGVDSE